MDPMKLQEILDDTSRELMIDFRNLDSASTRILSYYDTILFVNNKPLNEIEIDGEYDISYENFVPVGLVQTSGAIYERDLPTLGELGSAATVTITSKASKSMNIGRMLHKDRSLLKALYRGTLKGVPEFDNHRILSDVTMPMFNKPFLLQLVIMDRPLDSTDDIDIKGITVYYGCTATSVGRSMEVGQRVTSEGASIMWRRTEEQEVP